MNWSFELDWGSKLFYLLLLIPGYWILWVQFRNKATKNILLLSIVAAQGLALTLLVFSLCEPVLVQKKLEFHGPVALLAIDQSESFLAGKTLHAETVVAQAKQAIENKYSAAKIEIETIDFGGRSEKPEGLKFTDYSVLAKMIENRNIKNLAAVFLISDGQEHRQLYSERLQNLTAPIYPIHIRPISLCECQASEVELLEGRNGEGVLQAKLDLPGKSQICELKLIADGKTLWSISQNFLNGTDYSKWDLPEKLANSLKNAKVISFIIRPKVDICQLSFWNDTVEVNNQMETNQKKLILISPLGNLSERGAVEALLKIKHPSLKICNWEEAIREAQNKGDQIWLGPQHWNKIKKDSAALAQKGVNVVFYSVPERSGFVDASHLYKHSLNTVLKAFDEGQAVFGTLTFRVNDFSTTEWKGWKRETNWKTIFGTDSSALIAVNVNSGTGAQLRVSLPAAWELFFQPGRSGQNELWKVYYSSLAKLGSRVWGGYGIDQIETVYPDKEFVIRGQAPTNSDRDTILELILKGKKHRESYPVSVSSGNWQWKGSVQETGKFSVYLNNSQDTLRKAGFRSLAKERLELSRLGIHSEFLNRLAELSNGSVLDWNYKDSTTNFPELSSEQTQKILQSKIPLFNRQFLFLLIVGLLASSWLLRKRAGLD